MRAILALGLLVAGLEAAPRTGVFTMTDGGRFEAKFLGVEKGKGMAWQHPAFEGVRYISPKGLRQLRLSVADAPGRRAHSARVRFRNGDELVINLNGLNANTMQMETWFAGKLSVPRQHLTWLVPGGEGELVYHGPRSLRGWGAALMGVILGDDGKDVGGVVITEVMADSPALRGGLKVGDLITHMNGKAFLDRTQLIQAVKKHFVGDKLEVRVRRGEKLVDLKIGLEALHWRFEEGALVTDQVGSMIGRVFEWPPLSELLFDLDWKSMPGMDVVICGDRVREYNAVNGYKLRLYQNYAHLYRNTSADGLTYNSTSIGTVSVKWPANKKAEIKVLVDQKNATISLLVSGKLLKTWKDPNGFAGRGGALGFNPQLADRMRISEIRLRQWNGQLPNGRDPQAAGGAEDHVHFSNGNNLKGKVGSMTEGKLMVKTSFAEVPVPLEKVATVVFAAPKAQPDEEKLAWITLGGEGRITGEILEWNAKGVLVRTSLFGEVTLDPAVVSSVQFR